MFSVSLSWEAIFLNYQSLLQELKMPTFLNSHPPYILHSISGANCISSLCYHSSVCAMLFQRKRGTEDIEHFYPLACRKNP